VKLSPCILLVVLLSASAALGAPRGTPARGRSASLREILVPGPADSLVEPLRRLQSGSDAGEAAWSLGLLQYARGEYAAARQSFARAQGRLAEPARGKARCWEALAWLAQGAPGRAQATLKPVLATAGPNREQALLLSAQALESGAEPARALPIYEHLLRASRPEPTALARAARLEAHLGHAERARSIGQRLQELYPASLEATAAGGGSGPSEHGRVWLNIGSFVSNAAARDLAERARKAGFDRAVVFAERPGSSARYLVRLGPYDSRDEASAAGERVGAALGTDYWLTEGR
jgi:tetratricopeptide (TPR) repeat protein